MEREVILCTPGNGVPKENVNVIYSSQHNRMCHPKFDKLIENVWREKLKNGQFLFNATKFRLKEVGTDKPLHVTFLLGLTSYKDFIGTNCSPFAQELEKEGIRNYQMRNAYFSDPLGVGALIRSSDDNFIFIRRSERCAEFPHFIDRAGGHPEPDEVTDKYNRNLDDVEFSAIADELYDSTLREVRDEVNIPIENLHYPVLLGVSYNDKTFYRPSLEFYIRCDLTTDEIKAKYNEQTHCEKDESTELIIIPASEILSIPHSNAELWAELTPSSKSAINLLSVFGTKK